MSSGVLGYRLMSSDVILCHLLSYNVICRLLLSSVVICCHLLSSVVICCHLLSSVVIWCHSCKILLLWKFLMNLYLTFASPRGVFTPKNTVDFPRSCIKVWDLCPTSQERKIKYFFLFALKTYWLSSADQLTGQLLLHLTEPLKIKIISSCSEAVIVPSVPVTPDFSELPLAAAKLARHAFLKSQRDMFAKAKFECDQCNITITEKEEFESHMKTHTRSKV